MDIQRLFLRADGRIGRGEFWTGFLILFVLGIVVHFVPVIGQIISIILIYPWVCLFSKRLHDMGKSGWLQLIPYAVWIVAIVVAVMSGMGGAIMSMAGGSNGQATAGALAGAGMALMVLMVACLINLIFLLWVGLSPSQAGENAYGPPAGTALVA